MISKNHFEEGFRGFHIHECAVRARGIYSFVLLEDIASQANAEDAEPLKRLVTYFVNVEGKPLLGWREFTGYAAPRLAVAQKPRPQAVMVSRDCGVAALGSGVGGMEADIPHGDPTKPMYTSVEAVATIDGYVYAAGPWRAVARRLGPNQWEGLADRKTLPVPKRNRSGSNNEGFNAIDGFNAKDIYAGGGHGDLWRYDGERWRQCAIPTNMIIENVCCAGDGFVYVGMQSGSVLKGRENNWKIIHKGNFTIPFRDIVWYGGRVWCTSDYGTWTIEDDRVEDAPLSAAIRCCSGNLSAADGVMLLAGMYGAAVFDGANWEVIIDSSAGG